MPRSSATLLNRIVERISSFSEALGRILAWLCLGMMAVTCAVVVLRYLMGIGSIALQESVTYMHGTLFMLGTVVALKRGAHVRVDIMYRRLTLRRQALVDLLGTLFLLLPVCLFMLIWCWDYVIAAWQVQEGSADAGGLRGVYLLKTLIPVTAVLLIIQGLAEILRNGLIIAGHDLKPTVKGESGATMDRL